ncbi:substrate-binding domain-containing protein [Effusibacillus consociatus]
MVCTLLLLALVGCGGNSSETNQSANQGSKDNPKVVVVLKTLSSQYWKFVEAGAKQAFKDFKVDGKVLGPASESQIVEQVNMMEDVLTEKPDALVVAPTQPSTAISAFQKYKDKGIPVLLVDTDAEWADKKHSLELITLPPGRRAGNCSLRCLRKGIRWL